MMDVKDTKQAKKKKPAVKKTARFKPSSNKKTGRTSKVNELKKKIEKLTNELNSLKDKYLRTVAEFDNFKKRKDREVLDIIERANEQFCLELLPVIDDFERSLNTEIERKSYKSLKQGIELIYQKLISILKKQGIEPIESIGQQFDPELHAAIMQIEDKEKPSNVIVDEALKGYRRREKVLRYSQVVVNK